VIHAALSYIFDLSGLNSNLIIQEWESQKEINNYVQVSYLDFTIGGTSIVSAPFKDSLTFFRGAAKKGSLNRNCYRSHLVGFLSSANFIISIS